MAKINFKKGGKLLLEFFIIYGLLVFFSLFTWGCGGAGGCGSPYTILGDMGVIALIITLLVRRALKL